MSTEEEDRERYENTVLKWQSRAEWQLIDLKRRYKQSTDNEKQLLDSFIATVKFHYFLTDDTRDEIDLFDLLVPQFSDGRPETDEFMLNVESIRSCLDGVFQ